MSETANTKKTILHLPPIQAITWCQHTRSVMSNLWLRELNFRDASMRHIALSIDNLMADGRRTANPHLRRVDELRHGECELSRDLLNFLQGMEDTLRGKRQSPFTQDKDEVRPWLIEKRKALKQKIKRERKYRSSVPYPDKGSATENESVAQEDIVLLLDELIKKYPPKKLPRPKAPSQG